MHTYRYMCIYIYMYISLHFLHFYMCIFIYIAKDDRFDLMQRQKRPIIGAKETYMCIFIYIAKDDSFDQVHMHVHMHMLFIFMAGGIYVYICIYIYMCIYIYISFYLFICIFVYIAKDDSFDLMQRQKRPTVGAKETYYRGKRDLL